MSKYRVFFITEALAGVTVEAESEEDARERAYEELPTRICAQCSGWDRDYSLDLGDWQPDESEDAVIEVDE